MKKQQISDFVEEMEKYKRNFIAYNKISNKSINTINTYENCLNSFLEYCYENNGELSFDNLQKSNITDYFIWLDELYIKKHKKKSIIVNNGVSISTKINYLTILKIFFKYITENNNKLLDLENILYNYKIKNKKSNKLDNFMKESERERILDFINEMIKNNRYKDYRNSLLIKLMLKSGLRISEVLNLKFSDFQLSEDNEFYDINILAKGGEYQTAYILKDYVFDEFMYLLKHSSSQNYIFTDGVNNKPITRQNVYALLKRIYRKCGIMTKQGCHILRHSFAMNLVEKNTNLGVIQTALRHKKIQTTMIYAQANGDMVKKEMKRVCE